ncbi:hypothetical protein [Rhizobium alvei]|uniref:Uncharacterized protein n=1 Tax=Rhizobium alvei TaxID=1132659 RepID=A0ABT8YK07_9HYPH|nr:hypothetical protein [Rhizobium alvei]MDO6964005.1 hypothetical protein [Rhizobium alvei]
MARTFIGELILRLKDEMSGKAKAAASNLEGSVEKIQRAAQRMNQTSWGGQFEERLRKLGASAGDIDKLRKAWDGLNTSFEGRNLSKSLQAMEKSNFKTASLAYFAEIAAGADKADKSVSRFHSRWKEAAKDMAVYGTIGTLMYGGANALRGGVFANAEFIREKSRWKDANIPDSERDAAIAEADKLTTQYPSAGLLNMVELARKARAMMGDNERGLAILPDLAKAFVALQSAKGTDAAVQELEGFLKGADVAGLNAPGAKGIESVRQVIGGWVRAAQVEGRDLDVGKFLEFSRYGKMAVPSLSDRFLAGVLPAIVQDYGPSQFGNALNMAYKSFVIGSNSVAGKKNLAAQRNLGIRVGEGKGELVEDQLFASDPYAWVNSVLIPALQKKGIDTENATAVNKAIAELAANSNSTTVLTRMVTQKAQIDRLLQQYDAAKGLESADTAAAQDPFVAWKGFTESWRELASAVKGMPEVIGGLNMLTGGIQRFATALRNDSGAAQAALAGAGVGALFAGWKVMGAVWGLITAGTNLNAAAVALEAAAVSLGGAGVAGDAAGKKPGPGNKAGLLGILGRLSPVAAALLLSGDSRNNPYTDAPDDKQKAQRNSARDEAGFQNRYGFPSYDPRKGQKADTEGRAAAIAIYDHAVSLMEQRKMMETVTTPYNPNTPGLDQFFKPTVDLGDAIAAAAQAGKIGEDITRGLTVSATPQVNNAQLQETLRLVNAIKAGLAVIGGSIAAAHQSVAREMNRNFSDHGIVP